MDEVRLEAPAHTTLLSHLTDVVSLVQVTPGTLCKPPQIGPSHLIWIETSPDAQTPNMPVATADVIAVDGEN
jgi:hypothetical protein